MKLSQKRMNEVISYFHKNGIDLLRMTYKAYGESKLLNQCGDDAECEDAMHQINRRTELKIILKREGRYELAQKCFKTIPVHSELDILKFSNIFEH